MAQIIAREQELEILERLYRSKEPEFLAIYGRRRVGKTFLIRNYFQDKGVYFEITGVPNASLSEQLKNFSIAFADRFYHGKSQSIPKDWIEAFTLLRHQIEQINSKQKVILFFDELPWLSSKRSGFLSALEYFWNRYLSGFDNVILVVCGSAALWMIRKIIYNKGGLYGRLTAEIRLQPYTLRETERYLQARGVELDRRQIVEIYMAMGGIPKYLNVARKGMSSAQIIQTACFSEQGPLMLEFNKLYASLFEHHDRHLSIVEALAGKHSGMDQEEILRAIPLQSGGTFTKTLRELEESGFIKFIPQFGKKKKEGNYCLIDQYSLFYLQWIKPAINHHVTALSKDYWLRMQVQGSYRAWAGYAFEGICLQHIQQIVKALEISVVATSATGWYYRSSAESDQGGAQIDLVIDRADQCINLCEIKFSNAPFTINKEYARRLEHKLHCFREVTKSRKTLFTTLITPYGVQQNRYYFSSVHNQITIDQLFE